MNAEDYARLEQLFLRARELPPAQRSAFLGEVAHREPQLVAELERLFRHERDADPGSVAITDGGGARILAYAIQGVVAAPDAGEGSPEDHPFPTRFGRYRIVRRIGQGGMGEVFEAEQDDPRRRVALKLIRNGAHSPQLMERFRREAQMLGRLRHRGIAQIYDADTSGAAGDVPFFAMELVDGPPLLRFAQDRRLDTRQRLELIAEVCDALQHAHERGLVHRDLKPGNVLVAVHEVATSDGTASLFHSIEARIGGQPKILDFGIARSDEFQTLTEIETGRLIGTVPYMSPEQAGGQELDARSDIYSVGVIAFELLAGRLPYDLNGKALHEAARIVREQEPVLLGRLDRRWAGDIQVLVGKALEKDRARRYESAGEFADDIRRFLSDQPIRARPASVFYRLRKLAKRRRAVVSGSTVAALSLVVCGILYVLQRGEVRSAENESRRQQIAADDEAWERYVASITAAAAAVQNQDPQGAQAFLDAADAGRGTWEYNLVASRLDAYGDVIETATPIRAAAFAADDRTRITASEGGLIEWWKPGAATPVRVTSVQAQLSAVAFSLFGDRLAAAVGSTGEDVVVWDCESGAEIASLSATAIEEVFERGGAARVTVVALSPNGESLAVGADGLVVLHIATGERWNARCGDRVSAVAFSEDGTRLVCAYKQEAVRATAFVQLFDVDSGEPLHGRVGCPYRINALWVPGNGDSALVGTGKNGAKFVRFPNGAKGGMFGASESITAVVAASEPGGLSNDGLFVGLRLATANSAGEIQMFLARPKGLLRSLAGPGPRVTQLVYSCDGTQLVATSGNIARTYHLAPIDAMTVLTGPDAAIAGVAFLSDFCPLAVGVDGSITKWSANREEPVSEIPGIDSPVACAAVASAKGLIALGAFRRVRLLSISDGAALRDFEADQDVVALGLSPDEALLLIRTTDELSLREIDTGDTLWVRRSGGSFVPRVLAFSPDGLQFATADAGAVRLWSVAGGDLTGVFSVDGDDVTGLAFSPDEVTLAAGMRSGGLLIWDTTSGALLKSLSAHDGELGALAFAPRGARLATGGDDGLIGIWDTERWTRVMTLSGHEDSIRSLAFSTDGARLASGSDDETVRIWCAEPH